MIAGLLKFIQSTLICWESPPLAATVLGNIETPVTNKVPLWSLNFSVGVGVVGSKQNKWVKHLVYHMTTRVLEKNKVGKYGDEAQAL